MCAFFFSFPSFLGSGSGLAKQVMNGDHWSGNVGRTGGAVSHNIPSFLEWHVAIFIKDEE